MSLRHTILAMLETGEGTGYGIAKKFQGTFNYFWNASHQQVYQELGKLSNDGLVEFTSVEQSGKPDKKIYRITEKGHQELIKWIGIPNELPKVKDELVVKLVVGHLVDPQILRTQMLRAKELHKTKLEALHIFEQEHFSEELPAPEVRLRHLTLKRGIEQHESWLRWAEEVEEVINLMQEPCAEAV